MTVKKQLVALPLPHLLQCRDEAAFLVSLFQFEHEALPGYCSWNNSAYLE